ncbi:MAG TPA: hypothetical protein VFI19_03170, partial [Nocardioides sp.]|nr:hypothetical protein [Nocardioides sp.]
MAADHQAPDAQSDDLFGRWLAHHEQQSGDGDTTGQDVTDHNPPPRPSRRLPAAAVASSAVQSDPMIGTRLQPPSSFGARRPDPNAQARPGSANEPQPAKGWEPIVIASARKKTEKPEIRSTPKPPEQPSRFQRLKARFVDQKESTPEPEATTEPDPPVAARAPLPTRTPTPLVTRSIEETIRAAVPEHQGARHVDVPVERQVAEQPQAPAATVVETVEPVARTTEPEEITPPTPVRAFIDVTPLIDQHEPEPVPEERGPKHAALRAPEPEPALAPLVDDEPVVAESVVAEAEPELTLEPVIEFVVESTLAVEPKPAPVAFVEPQPEPQPEPVAVVESQPEPIAAVEPQPVPEPIAVVAAEPEPIAVVEPEPEPVAAIEPEPESALVALSVTEEEAPPAPSVRRSFLSRGLCEPKQPKQP